MMVLIHTVYTAVFWLNAFPNISEKQWFSSREIITGLTIDYKRDCKAVVGAYVEASTDSEITNDNAERRQHCIYLGPEGNGQGSIKCFVIETDAVVVRRVFEVLSCHVSTGEGRAAGHLEKSEEVEDLAAMNVVLQIKAWDAERRWPAAEDELEGHQVSRAEAGRGEPEEGFEEMDVQLEKDSRTIKQLEGGGGTGDNDGAERRKH